MTRSDQPGEEPYQPGAGSSGPPSGGNRPAEPWEPVPHLWDWAIDPPPPGGPNQEPRPDPSDRSTLDEVPEPVPPTGRYPDSIAAGAGPPSPVDPAPPARTAPASDSEPPAPAAPSPEPPVETGPDPAPPGGVTAAAPDWSTPETPASIPPLSGYPQPQRSWTGGPAPGPGPTAGPPTGSDPVSAGSAPRVPEFVHPADRRWWFLLGIVAALLSCCCVAAAVVTLVWGPDLYGGLRDRGPRVVGLNQPARDGDLEFQVREVRCGLTEVGDPLVSQLAVGQFCLVNLAVRNLGRQPVVFHDDLQLGYGPAGQRFGVDSSAGLLANADQLAFLSEINPGNRVTGAIVYDIPADSRIVRLRLRGSATSVGIQVRTG